MGPQARLEGCPHPAPAKERFMSGSGSPGRLQDNLSRDSGVGGGAWSIGRRATQTRPCASWALAETGGA